MQTPTATRRRSVRPNGRWPLVVATIAMLATGAGAARGEGATAQVPPSAGNASYEAVLEAARRTLGRHCARCHQAGDLERPAAAGGIARILDLDTLVRSPHLVRPGAPEGSPLFTTLVEAHAPLDLPEPKPSGAEVDAVRRWLVHEETARRARVRAAGCQARRRLDADDIAEAVRRQTLILDRETLAASRYLSLAHLFNACLPRGHISGLRSGLARLINGLTWSTTVHPADPVPGTRGLVMRIDLRRLGWTGSDWDAIAARAADGAAMRALGTRLPPSLGSNRAIIAGDAFAAAMLEPELYHQVLRLPAKLSELASVLGADLDGDAAKQPMLEIARSAVTGGSRAIRSIPAVAGSLWLAYDASPVVAGEGETAAAIDGSGRQTVRALFTLPNGYPAFGFYLAEGNRVERGDQGPSMAGCQLCHAGGPRLPHTAAVPTPGDTGSDEAGQRRLADAIAADRGRIEAALRETGLEPAETVDGLDPVSRLAAHARQPVDLARAAAETFERPASLAKSLATLAHGGDVVAGRLTHDLVPRDAFERLAARLAGGEAATGDRAGAGAAIGEHALVAISLGTQRFHTGDEVRISITSDRACHLTLINIDRGGVARVIYPNAFDPVEPLVPGRRLVLPPENARYAFRAGAAGRETLVAICAETAGSVLAIPYDFERQRFTILGDWGRHLVAAANYEPPPPRRRNGRRRGRDAEAEASPQAPPPYGWAAVTYDIVD